MILPKSLIPRCRLMTEAVRSPAMLISERAPARRAMSAQLNWSSAPPPAGRGRRASRRGEKRRHSRLPRRLPPQLFYGGSSEGAHLVLPEGPPGKIGAGIRNPGGDAAEEHIQKPIFILVPQPHNTGKRRRYRGQEKKDTATASKRISLWRQSSIPTSKTKYKG